MTKQEIIDLINEDLDKGLQALDEIFLKDSKYRDLSQEIISPGNNYSKDQQRSKFLRFIALNFDKVGIKKDSIEFFNENELAEIKKLEPNSLLIYIKDNKFVYLRPPNAAGFEYEISQEYFSQKVTGILQRLLLEDSMKEDEYEILGTSLFNRLFPDNEAKKEFCRLIEQPVGASPLQLILRFDEASSGLACLPWEYLYYPGDGTKGYFLGAKQELILTRRLSALYPGNYQPSEMKELKILIAVASYPPENESAYKAQEHEENQIENVLHALKDTRISPKIKYFDSIAGITDLINDEGVFHVLHFIGDARLNPDPDVKGDDKYEVALSEKSVTGDKEIEWMTHKKFIACFGEKKPTLIFLHARKDSQEDAYLGFSGFAFHLAKDVPGVIVIQAPVNSTNTVNFLTFMYRALKEGADLDLAVNKSLRQVAEDPANLLKPKKAYGMSAVFSCHTLRLNFSSTIMDEPLQRKSEYCPMDRKIGLKTERCNNELWITNGKPELVRCDQCGNKIELCPHCNKIIKPSWKKDGRCYKCDNSLTDLPLKEESVGFEDINQSNNTIAPAQFSANALDVRNLQSKN